MYFTKALSVAFLFVCLGLSTFGQCVHVGGGVITNIGVITSNRTLGTATGDLKGAIGVEILSQSSGPGGTTVFSVHHFWVTEAGDTIFVEPALLTAVPVAPGLFAVVTYPVSISGGTGKFKGASGKLNVIGEADFNAGHIGLRYDGEVCFEKEEASWRQLRCSFCFLTWQYLVAGQIRPSRTDRSFRGVSIKSTRPKLVTG